MTTISEIYTAINPLPAQLSVKGKVKPKVELCIEANANISISMNWQKFGSDRDWERDYEYFSGANADEAIAKAIEFINTLPSAKQAKLQRFMEKLGRVIDAGQSEGIDVDFLNPLIKTMKRLSENVLTYKPRRGKASAVSGDRTAADASSVAR